MIDLQKELKDRVICRVLNKAGQNIDNIKRICSKLDDLDRDKANEELKDLVFWLEVLRGYKQ